MNLYKGDLLLLLPSHFPQLPCSTHRLILETLLKNLRVLISNPLPPSIRMDLSKLTGANGFTIWHPPCIGS